MRSKPLQNCTLDPYRLSSSGSYQRNLNPKFNSSSGSDHDQIVVPAENYMSSRLLRYAANRTLKGGTVRENLTGIHAGLPVVTQECLGFRASGTRMTNA